MDTETSRFETNVLIKDALATEPIPDLQPLIVRTDEHCSVNWKALEELRRTQPKAWIPAELPGIPFPMPTFRDPELSDDIYRRLTAVSGKDVYAEQEVLFYKLTLIPMPLRTSGLVALTSSAAIPHHMNSHPLFHCYIRLLFFILGKNYTSPLGTTANGINEAEFLLGLEGKAMRESLLRNLFGTGMMQHYFDDLQPDAPKMLCAILAQYTLRIVQAYERMILRLTPLGCTPETVKRLCTPWNFFTSDELTPEIRKALIESGLYLYDIHLSNAAKEFADLPFLSTAPTREYVEKCDEFNFGVHRGTAEMLLWVTMARAHQDVARTKAAAVNAPVQTSATAKPSAEASDSASELAAEEAECDAQIDKINDELRELCTDDKEPETTAE